MKRKPNTPAVDAPAGPTAQLPGAPGGRGPGRSPVPGAGRLVSYAGAIYGDPAGTPPRPHRVSGASPVPGPGGLPLWVTESASPHSNTGDRTYNGLPPEHQQAQAVRFLA